MRVFQYEGRLETIKETLNLIGLPKAINGPIIKQIAEAHDYVLSLLRSGMRVPSGFVTKYRIPERAVKEAITNAVIHRDYHTKRDIEIMKQAGHDPNAVLDQSTRNSWQGVFEIKSSGKEGCGKTGGHSQQSAGRFTPAGGIMPEPGKYAHLGKTVINN